MKVLHFIAVLVFASAVKSRPNNLDDDDYDLNIAEPEYGLQNDNYDYDGTDDDNDEPDIPDPVLTTKPRDFIAKQNQTVHLPCNVQNGGSLVAMWRKNNEIIFQDTIRFNSFGNQFQVANKTLIITNVGANETANYTCSIPLTKTETLSVTHRLFVETAPKIESLKSLLDITEIDAGKTLVLTCIAVGYPKPTIKWSKKGERLSSEGETITIENISHHDSGDYQCLADNNIEPPAHQYIHISIVHKPDVSIEKLTVNSDENLDSQLICYVHAVPKAKIVWKKDGRNVIANDRKHFKHHNHTYILEIRQVQAEDFGVYTCSAYNRVGRSEKNVTLTGYPSPAEHKNTTYENDRSINLVWNLESYSPVIKYDLEYKKTSDSEWKSVVPEVVNPDGSNIFTINYTFNNLPSGHYEAKVRALNTYGWSDHSKIVEFNSAGSHKHHKQTHNKPEQVTLKQETPNVPIVQGGFPLGNVITVDEEQPVAIQTPEPPPLVAAQVPSEEYSQTEQKPHTQERQLQAGINPGNSANSIANMLPILSLLCIAVLTTFSH